MYLTLLNLIIFNVNFINSELNFIPANELNLTLGHVWSQRDETLTIYFDIPNSTFEEYRYYYFDFRPFASHDHIEYYPRQRLTDTHNSLSIIGLHEADYVSCVSFIDEFENIYKPRYGCYEFTIGEKTIGEHHGGSTGYLAPLLLAVAFVIHVLIAVIHYIKEKNYIQTLLRRFIDVNPKTAKRIINIKQSLKELDHPYIPASVQRRLSRVSIDVSAMDRSSFSMKNTAEELQMIPVPTQPSRRVSASIMQTIPENIA